MIDNYTKEVSQIYAQNIPARCQLCRKDSVPEPYTWLNMLSLFNKGERIFFCGRHIDYEDTESIYFNLTDSIIWCRKCETRFNTKEDFTSTIGKILNTTESPGTRGLKNLGNTCFMNSVIQALSNCSQLKYFCIESYRKYMGTNNPGQVITDEFIQLIKIIWIKGNILTPSPFVDAVYEGTEMFIRKQQSDSHEFLIFLLNTLNDCLKEGSNKIIEECFQGEILNKTHCLACNKVFENTEKFFDITLPIIDDTVVDEGLIKGIYKRFSRLFKKSKKIDLKECISTNFETFEAGDEDMPNWKYCYNCSQKVPFKKEMKLKTPPKNLILVLKRYSRDSKSSSKVYFPEQVDLAAYLIENEGKANYTIYSIIEHSGFMNMGHYRSYCVNHMDKKWYCFNDNTITEIDLKTVLKIQGYIAFYELQPS